MSRYSSEQTTYVFYNGKLWNIEQTKYVSLYSGPEDLFLNMNDFYTEYTLVDAFNNKTIMREEARHCEFTVNGKGKTKTISWKTYDFVKNSLNTDERRQFNNELYDLGIKIC